MPIETFTLVPNTGRDYVELTSWAGDAVFPVTPAADDQIEHDDDLTVGADGAVTGADGTYTLRLVKADTGTVYAISYEIGEVEPEEPGVATSTFTLIPPDNHAVVTLASGFDISLFQGEGNEWAEGEPAIGWQIVYPTFQNTIINNLAELQTDATDPFDIWVVDLDGVWYGTYITPIPAAAEGAIPDNPGNQSVTDAALSTVIEFTAFEVTGVDAETDIPTTIVNGEYRVNAGSYGSAGVNLLLGDMVQVRHTSSDAHEAQVVTTLNMNGVSVTFTSTTIAAEVEPGLPPAGTPVFGTPTVTATSISAPYTYALMDATGFQRRVNAGAWVSTPNPVLLTSLVTGVEYTLDVRAVNEYGEGPHATIVRTTQASGSGGAAPRPPGDEDGLTQFKDPSGRVVYDGGIQSTLTSIINARRRR